MAEGLQKADGRQIEADPDEIQVLGVEILPESSRNVSSRNVYYSRFQRFKKQKQAWLEHLRLFKWRIIGVLVSSIFGLIAFVSAFFVSEVLDVTFHIAAAVMMWVSFSFYWVFIPAGPPFISEPNGRMVRSDFFTSFGYK